MIADYPELVAEVTHRSKQSDVANRASMYVGLAERMLSKRLRLSDMLTETTLTTDSSGSVNLPTGFQEMSTLYVGDCELHKQPLSKIIGDYVEGYAVVGQTIRSSYKSTEHAARYFAAVPGLEVANTSWLLDREPELYLQAVIFQVYTGNNMVQEAQVVAGYLSGLIEDANAADYAARLSGAHVVIGGNTP